MDMDNITNSFKWTMTFADDIVFYNGSKWKRGVNVLKILEVKRQKR